MNSAIFFIRTRTSFVLSKEFPESNPESGPSFKKLSILSAHVESANLRSLAVGLRNIAAEKLVRTRKATKCLRLSHLGEDCGDAHDTGRAERVGVAKFAGQLRSCVLICDRNADRRTAGSHACVLREAECPPETRPSCGQRRSA